MEEPFEEDPRWYSVSFYWICVSCSLRGTTDVLGSSYPSPFLQDYYPGTPSWPTGTPRPPLVRTCLVTHILTVSTCPRTHLYETSLYSSGGPSQNRRTKNESVHFTPDFLRGVDEGLKW